MSKVSHGSKLAANQCQKTAKIILERGKTHGDAFAQLQDLANRWTSRLRAKGYTGPDLTVEDVCYFMNEVKLSRSAFGNPKEIDHFNDTMGYSAIGAAHIAKDSVKPEEATSGDQPGVYYGSPKLAQEHAKAVLQRSRERDIKVTFNPTTKKESK